MLFSVDWWFHLFQWQWVFLNAGFNCGITVNQVLKSLENYIFSFSKDWFPTETHPATDRSRICQWECFTTQPCELLRKIGIALEVKGPSFKVKQKQICQSHKGVLQITSETWGGSVQGCTPLLRALFLSMKTFFPAVCLNDNLCIDWQPFKILWIHFLFIFLLFKPASSSH